MTSFVLLCAWLYVFASLAVTNDCLALGYAGGRLWPQAGWSGPMVACVERSEFGAIYRDRYAVEEAEKMRRRPWMDAQ